MGLFCAGANAAPETYKIDPGHTSVIASWSHFGFSHPTAAFNGAEGTITFDADSPEDAKISVSMDVETVDSFVEKLNEEFLGKDYFDVESHPKATFKSTKVVAKGGDKYDVHGDLTIKGITKPVVMHATLNKQGKHPMNQKPTVGFDAEAEIMRSEFGLGKYVPNVGDKVKLRITTEAQQ
ncbi:polyisoprenoid-binding protein [Alteromonas pelagimontana]|uniref:Polyisoprenoid-binding protein n=2 Tax=Alteromonas pelagimontana TaxID=1858656 RepID=A0A6M4MIC6_9ALTE|nr:polyisoprenoid-binding protein [Alteromonas pelagimontana]